MKHFQIYLFSLLLLYGCGGDAKSNAQDNLENTQMNQAIDTSSAEAFILTFTEKRKALHPKEFEISAKCVLDKGGFRIINFVETIGNYSYEYGIVMNPLKKVSIENPEKETYVEVMQWINENKFNMSLYQGNFSPLSFDFKGEGANDFELVLDESYRTDISILRTIIVYDGKNGLEKTEIIARTNSTENENGSFSGIQESFEFKQKGKNLPEIILTHKENDFKPDAGSQKGVGNFEYTLTRQWSEKGSWGEPEWITTFKGDYKNCQSAINEFTKPRYLLSDEYEGYAIVENCQNGGPDHFVLNLFSDDLGNRYYVLGDNYDDIGSNILLAIFELENNYLLLFARNEKMESNTKGFRHIGNNISTQFIAYNNGSDLESHWGALSNGLFTITKEKYSFIPCQQP